MKKATPQHILAKILAWTPASAFANVFPQVSQPYLTYSSSLFSYPSVQVIYNETKSRLKSVCSRYVWNLFEITYWMPLIKFIITSLRLGLFWYILSWWELDEHFENWLFFKATQTVLVLRFVYCHSLGTFANKTYWETGLFAIRY